MADVLNWLLGYAEVFLSHLSNALIAILQAVIDGLGAFIAAVLALLPSGSTIPALPSIPTGSTWAVFLNALNWFFPISYIVTLVTWGTGAIALYFSVCVIGRWAKILT